MLMLWVVIAAYEILTAHAENACQSGKYKVFEESKDGYCFFLLPESEYVETLYEMQKDLIKYRLAYERADGICARHDASVMTGNFLRLPRYSKQPSSILAARKLRERSNKTVFAGCHHMNDTGDRHGTVVVNDWRCNFEGKKPSHVLVMVSKDLKSFSYGVNQFWKKNELPALACYQYQQDPAKTSPRSTIYTRREATTKASELAPIAHHTKPPAHASTTSKFSKPKFKPTTTTVKPSPTMAPSQKTATQHKKPSKQPRPEVENPCRSGKYKNFEGIPSDCFFEPPESEYVHVINELDKGSGNYNFDLVKARQICKNHKARLLSWDISKDGLGTQAIKRLKKKINLDIPVDCFVEQDTMKVNCDKGPAVVPATYYAFISHEDKFYAWSERSYYARYMSGLICEMPT